MTKPKTATKVKPLSLNQSKAKVIAVFGARGTGKSAWIKKSREVSAAKRLIVWDYMHEYQSIASPVSTLGEVLQAMRSKAWRVAYQVDHTKQDAAFEFLTSAARTVGNCTFLAEELAFVTKANKAPPAWRQATLLGRHSGMTIIGASQRPASVDKDFIACADIIHCGRLANEPDAKAVATFLGCDWRELINLPDLHYIELDVTKRETTRGVLKF
jgi:hypothetical protein